jgi:hypothetical protein
MGTILASAVLNEVRGIIQDIDSDLYSYSDTFLMTCLNNAQLLLVMLKPSAYTKNEAFQLAAGTKQDVPEGIGPIKLVRNMGTSGTVPGRAIFYTNMEQLAYIIPTLHSQTANAVVENYSTDKDDPAHFYVFPPQPATGMGWVEGIYPGKPADIAAIGSAITLPDHYKPTLVRLTVYEALSSEQDPVSSQNADKQYSMAAQELGVKRQNEDQSDPARKG